MVLGRRQPNALVEYAEPYPLTAIAERETPSGATITSSRVSQYSLVTPVSGASALCFSFDKATVAVQDYLPVA